MRIPRWPHPFWPLVAFALLLAATWYYASDPEAPGSPIRGSTRAGFVLGASAAGLIVFAALYLPRRLMRSVRIGRPQCWLRAHIWLGLLSLPLAVYHSGFRWGGPLPAASLAVLLLVVASGVLGRVLQKVLPGVMLRGLEHETIYSQVAHVRDHLRAEALAAVAPLRDERRAAPLVEFYERSVAPYLAGRREGGAAELIDEGAAAHEFGRVASLGLPEEARQALGRLRTLCEESRQYGRQQWLHFGLHVWLSVHLPLSAALLVLLVLHVIFSALYL